MVSPDVTPDDFATSLDDVDWSASVLKPNDEAVDVNGELLAISFSKSVLISYKENLNRN